MEGDAPHRKVFRFGSYELDSGQRILERNGTLVSIPPKAIDILVLLVEQAGHVLDKETIFRTVWPDTFVVESSLTKNISVLRQAIDSPGQNGSLIQTISKRGYRFVGNVSEEQGLEPSARAPVPESEPGVAPGRRTQRASRLIVASIAGFLLVAVTYPRKADIHADASQREGDRLYQIGRYIWSKFDRVETMKALEQFERAAEADPRSALAYSGVADANVLLTMLGAGGPANLSRARQAALRAIELDPSHAAPHVSLGWVRTMADLDPRGAEREYKRALKLNPTWVPALYTYSCLLAHSGRLEQARGLIRRASEIDPASPLVGVHAARIEIFDHKYQRAIDMLEGVLLREPSFRQGHYYMSQALGLLGRTARARHHLNQAGVHASLLATDQSWLDSVDGNREPARALVAHRSDLELDALRKATVLVMPAIAAGNKELALECLSRMWDKRRLELLEIGANPRFDTLRSDPRFADLVRRVWPDQAGSALN